MPKDEGPVNRRLAHALDQAGFPAAMCAAAAAGFYSDFGSTLAAPKVELIDDIRQAPNVAGEKRQALIDRVTRGEFDG